MRLTKKTPTISKYQYRVKETGLSPKELAAEHKAGLRRYQTAASEEQAKKQIANKRRTKRIARRNRAAEAKGFKQGKKQRRAVLYFIEDAYQRHEHYLATNEGRLDSDEYRKAVHLTYEYFGDDDRTERMKMSYQITALAA